MNSYFPQILGFINIPPGSVVDEIQLFENHFLTMGITMIAWISSIQWYHMSPKYSISGQQKHRSCWKTPAFCQNSSFQPKYCSQNSDFHHILHGKQRNCMENCQIACSTSSNSSKSLLCFDFHEHSKNPGTFIFQTLMFTQGVYLNFLDSESTASQSSYLIWTSSSYVGDDQVGSTNSSLKPFRVDAISKFQLSHLPSSLPSKLIFSHRRYLCFLK